MTFSTTGDRRWGTTRRSGMTILGKVAVPKPINLPSQRLENQGLDPNVEIVPKGTLSWGSKSPLNAWGTSSLSPRTESGPGSPSHLSNRPSSGGSVTRPSTADSDKAHDSSSTAWDANSRPSSASGVFPSNQASVALQRPHSADTRPGSSHLSRFAESVSETSATWGQHGVAPTKKDGFSLTSGDFPSLGTEKESTEKSAMPQDAGPGTRPASSSGRSAEERGVDQEANVRIGDDSAWRRDNQPYSENKSRYCREEGQLDSRGLQPYPNANFPHQYDAWRGPPVNNHQGGGWYRGNQPYGAPMGPGGFHVDPFPFYPTQVPPVPGHEAGPRGNHAINEKMFRPPILDTYVHPRPGFYHGPVPREGYYGPPMGYGGPSNRDLPFAGRPAGPHAYHQHPGQGRYDTSASSVALERNEPSHSQERQYKILLKPQDGRLKEDEAKREEFLGNRPSTAEKVAPHMQTSKNNRRVNNNEKSGEVQPITVENAAREDPSLIQKIEGLNAKTTFNSETSANKVSARMPRSGHASDSQNSLPYKQVDPATNKSVELAAISGTTISRRSTQQTQGGADHQAKQRVNSGGNDGWRKTAVMSGSSAVTLAPNPERFAEINVGDSLDTDSIGKPGSGISVEPNDNQRTTMRELARQRTQQRQKEEEERARDQRAKALAKLEELNRRSQLAGESSVKNLEAAHNASTPDMPEVPLSHSPASREKKTTVTAEDSIEVTEDSGKTLLPSPEDANNEGSTQHDNPPRHQVALPQNRNAWVISRSKISYLRKTLGKLSISQEGTPCSPVTKPGSSVPSAGEKKDISKKSQAGKNPTGFADSKTSRHVPNSWGVGASFNECPFSGVNGSSPNPMNLNKYPLGVRHSKKGSNDDYWTSSLGVFHKGIQCDGCEVVPITGPRFKSKVKEDYDLCNNCFSVMGNEWDYTRMDEPVSVRHLHPFGGQRVPFSNPWLGPALPPHHGVSDFRSTWTKLDSRFVLDVNVIDGTVVAPSAAFTKIWKMRNNGSLVWPRGTQIFWIGGDRFSNSFAVDLQIPAEGVPINGELDVKVDFVAPELPGRYISYWMMASPIGVKFGQRVWVSINVDASLKGTDANEFHGLNLNAFPDETFAREFTGTNVNYEPAQTGSSSVNGTLKGADLEREAAGPQIPGNDDLLVGDVEPVVPNTLTPSSSSSSSLVGFRNMRTVEALGGGYSFTMDTPAPLQEDIEKNELETTMLKELEEMGFKEIDLNKEILKENEYNLEQSVEALCGVSEWDPILEELQEMGFSDEVTNKRLLKKNNGSIKDVVMDLLTGDKEA